MRKSFIGIILASILGISTVLTGCGSSKDAGKQLTVYTALEEDQIKIYKEGFENKYPDIKLNIVRDSTGIITSKLLSEKDNPQADVVWGVGASNLLVLEQKGVLGEYKPEGYDKILPQFKDNRENPTWVGMEVSEGGITVNKKELDAKGLPVPKSYEDLINPKYKGLITMPNPTSSGTGYLIINGILQTFGEEKGCEYLDKLHENIANYTQSGSKPAVLSGKGEYPIGISMAYRGMVEKEKSNGNLEVVFPEDGIFWDVEANALVKKDNIKEESKLFLDWAISEQAMDAYNTKFPIVTIDKEYKLPEGYPENIKEKLAKIDPTKAAQDRDTILAKWKSNYEGKSEKK